MVDMKHEKNLTMEKVYLKEISNVLMILKAAMIQYKARTGCHS